MKLIFWRRSRPRSDVDAPHWRKRCPKCGSAKSSKGTVCRCSSYYADFCPVHNLGDVHVTCQDCGTQFSLYYD